jgi:hypothetical protein
VGFTDWKVPHPDNYTPDDPHCAASLAGEDCVCMDCNGWLDKVCEFKIGELGGDGEMPGMSSCDVYRNPFACSKPTTPSKAHGGPVHGCRNGGWLMGTAHADLGLPPTIVPTESAPQLHERLCQSLSRRTACTTRASTTRARRPSSAWA